MRNISAKTVVGIAGIAAGLIIGWQLSAAQAQNISISTATNCDSNAVVWCGASSVEELVGKYRGGDGRNSADSIHDIFSFFGISADDINDMNTNAMTVEAGQVSRAGNVFDDQGNVVATGALTAGRDDSAGSTRVSSGGTVFFTRPPSISFLNNRLAAYVVIMNGQFQFAILASCGNPIKATPVAPPPKPAPKPQPAPAPSPPSPAPQPTPQPAPMTPAQQPANVSVCSGNTTNSAVNNGNGGNAQGGNCSTNVVNNTSSPPVSAPPLICEALGINQGVNRTVTINNFMTNEDITATTASVSGMSSNMATFVNADINWGDGSSTTGVTNVIGQTHQFLADGTFTISVVAHFQMNGQIVDATGSLCQQQVTFVTPTMAAPSTPPTVTPTPTPPPAAPAPAVTQSSAPATPAPAPQPASTLVNTGPGSVIEIFSVAVIAGTAGYRYWLRRRLASR